MRASWSWAARATTVMSERFIPKEQSSAFERWQAVSFDKPSPERRAAVILPTADQIVALQQRAHDEGFASGLAEVRAQARQLGAVSAAFTGCLLYTSDAADDLLC